MLTTSSKLHSNVILLLVIVISCIFGFGFAWAIYLEKMKTVSFLLVLPLLLYIPFVLSRVPRQTIVSVLLLMFWLPIRVAIIDELYLFEIVIYCLMALVVMNTVISRNSTSELSLEGFPLKAFLLFVGGAILTYVISYKAGPELVRIRLFCLFPMSLCLFYFYTVRSEKDAERYLWMIYISGSLLALLFVMSDRFLPFALHADYAEGSGRFSLQLKIPFFDGLRILPASAGTYFGMLLCVGYYLLLTSVSVSKKMLVMGFSTILALGIILGQGRGGAAAAVCSIALMTLLHFRKATTKNQFGIVLIGFIIFSSLMMGGLWYFAVHSQHSGYYERIVGLVKDPFRDVNLLGRIARWEEGYITLLEKPLGIGFYGFHTTLSGDSSDVHNFYLYLWLSLGPIGFFGFFWIIYRFYKTFKESINIRYDSLRELGILGLGCIVFIGIIGMTSPLIWEPYTVVLIWAPLGITYAACLREKNKSLASYE